MKCYVLLAGGLGNQLFQYAAAVEQGASEVVFLDLISNERKNSSNLPDIIELNLPVPFAVQSFPHLNPTIRKFYLWLLGSTSRNSGIRIKIANSRLISIVTYALTVKLTGHKTKLLLENRIDSKLIAEEGFPRFLVGYFQNLDACNRISTELAYISAANSSERVESFLSPLLGKNLVGVHIRRGDYVGHATFGLLSDDYFRLRVRENISHREAIIFFSDTQIDFSIYLPEGHLIHSAICPTDFSATEVLLLMTKCKTLILSNSSLSWWAGFIIQNAGGKVVAPKPWFQKELHSTNFYPTNWICAQSLFTT